MERLILLPSCQVNVYLLIMTSFMAALIILWIMMKKGRCLPPGPLGWPLLGYLPNLGIAIYQTGKEPHRLFADMSKKFGKVFSLYMGSTLVVILNDYESIKEAFRNPHLNDRPVVHTYPGNEGGIILASGDTWRRQRRFTLSQFRNSGIGKSTFQDKIAEEVSFLRRELKTHTEKPIDLTEMLNHSVANIICGIIFGQRYEYTDEKFIHIVMLIRRQVELADNGGLAMFIPLLNYLNSSQEYMSDVSSNIRSFIQTIVDCHRKNFDSENMSDFIDIYLNEIEQEQRGSANTGDEPSSISEHNLCRTITHLFAAGTETTATTLLWCILFMVAYPEVQYKIQQEIDEVVGRNRMPRMSDQLPYTEATLMEVQRKTSIAPLGIPHIAAKDCNLNGYIIPEGTMLMSNIWAVHHDPAIWKEPHRFMPERFFDDNGSLFQPEEFIPFAIGQRKCIGENLAKMELFIAFTHLLHQFTFMKQSDTEEISFQGKAGVVISPQPFKTKIVERE